LSKQKRKLQELEKKLQAQTEIKVPSDVAKFCSQFLGFNLNSYEFDLAKKFAENQFVAVRWCRQSGKSFTVSVLLLHYALTNPNSYIAVVGPSWRQTKLIVRRINGFLTKLPQKWYGKPKMTMVELSNGSRIECFPNNPETIRGPTLDIVYCDEMNFIPNDEEMFDAIMWTLVTKKHGKFICSSTPWNSDSIFWRIWNEEPFKDYAKTHITWREAQEPNGPLSQKMLEQIRLQYEGDHWRWVREMEAEWSEDIDHWLSQSLIASCVNSEVELVSMEEHINGDFAVGVDLGKHQDYSVVAAVEKTGVGVLNLVHCYQFPLETPYATVIGYLKALTGKWSQISRIYVDKTGVGDPIVEEMVRAGLPPVEGVTFTESMKEQIATMFKQNMVEKLLQMPYDREIINELNVERFELTKAGRIKYAHPEGTHDDRFWAITLAVYAARQAPLPGKGAVMLPH
jgi:phage FluMu gp28-like protein